MEDRKKQIEELEQRLLLLEKNRGMGSALSRDFHEEAYLRRVAAVTEELRKLKEAPDA